VSLWIFEKNERSRIIRSDIVPGGIFPDEDDELPDLPTALLRTRCSNTFHSRGCALPGTGRALSPEQRAVEALISCVVPVFNGERFLAEALDSILGQTYTKTEVIVADDGSTGGLPQYGTLVFRRHRVVSTASGARSGA
jgi:hypothetical protein